MVFSIWIFDLSPLRIARGTQTRRNTTTTCPESYCGSSSEAGSHPKHCFHGRTTAPEIRESTTSFRWRHTNRTMSNDSSKKSETVRLELHAQQLKNVAGAFNGVSGKFGKDDLTVPTALVKNVARTSSHLSYLMRLLLFQQTPSRLSLCSQIIPKRSRKCWERQRCTYISSSSSAAVPRCATVTFSEVLILPSSTT